MNLPSLPTLARAAVALAFFPLVSAQAQSLSWTKRTTGVSSDITMNAVTYGGGKYVVVGYRGTFINNVNGIENQVSTSTDGATWTARTIVPTNGAIRSLAYGNGIYAAPVEDDASTNLILTSPDATTWTARPTGAGNLSSIAYGNGLVGSSFAPMWIGVGSANGGSNVVRSTDGTTWTRVNTGRSVDLFQVVNGNNVFLAISRSGTLLYSSTGTTWTVVTVPGTPSGAEFLGITFDGSEFLLLVNDGARNPQIYVSGDGAAWAASGSKLTSATVYDGTIAGNGTLAAIGGATSVNGNVAFTAPVTSGMFATVGAWSTAQVIDATGFGFVFISYVNNLWIAGGYDAALYTAAGTSSGTAPAITTQPTSQSIVAGSSVTFTAAASGSPSPTYQWKKDTTNIPSATSATLTLNNITASDAGTYTVVATNSVSSVTSSGAVLTVVPTAYLSNLSVRAATSVGKTLIAGFVVSGGAKPMLIRAGGPLLNRFGLTGVTDPSLSLYSTAASPATLIASNDNWDSTATPSNLFTTLGAQLFDASSKDAALQRTINGAHTANVTATNAGQVIAEVYDAGPNDGRRLTNLSARFQVGTGDNILIAGVVLGGTGTRQVLVRAIGPKLADYGVTGVLADPQFTVFDGSTAVDTNNDWSAALASTFTSVGAFVLTPSSGLATNDTKSAAKVITLTTGKVYTVQVSGVGATTGEALVELYELP